MSDIFRFKQFAVDQSGCAMKINTDGVLLGALAKTDHPQTILDIGTGTGVIALMLAQRFSDAQIDAVEIDEAAAKTAGQNFINSTFADRLKIHPTGFGNFFLQNPDQKYDLLVSNPPFYINSLESPGVKKKLAKHTDVCFFEGLVNEVVNHLTENGLCWLILPLPTAKLVKEMAERQKLYLHKTISIHSYHDSDPHREIVVFCLDKTKGADEQFIIYDSPKIYSENYQHKLKEFFTIF